MIAGVTYRNFENTTPYIIKHGITMIMEGHATTHIVIILPNAFAAADKNRTMNRIIIKSTDSQSFTSLLIIRPYGVISKKASFVLIV